MWKQHFHETGKIRWHLLPTRRLAIALSLVWTLFLTLQQQYWSRSSKINACALGQLPNPYHNPTCSEIFGRKRETFVRIPIDHVQDDFTPVKVPERICKESSAERALRLQGNCALLQYGDWLRNFTKSNQLEQYPTVRGEHALVHNSTTSKKMLKDLHEVAPWIGGDNTLPTWPLDQLPEADLGCQALAVCAGNEQLAYLHTLLHTIRVIYKSNITVYVIYKDNKDLSPETRDHIRDVHWSPGAKLIFTNLSKIFDLDKAQVDGWNLKAFGFLAVPATQILFLDVDVMLLQPPEKFFQLRGFREEGALFFRDRKIDEYTYTPRQFSLMLQPQLSHRSLSALTAGPLPTENIQESGVVIVDKARCFQALWAVCLLLGRWDVRKFAQKDLVYGDKEFYWTAFETVQVNYAFSRYYPGVLGDIITDFDEIAKPIDANNVSARKSNMYLCGRLLHYDDNGNPLWSNGGYLTNEDNLDSRGLSINHSAALYPTMFVGGDHLLEKNQALESSRQHWKFHWGVGAYCLYFPTNGLKKVPPEQAKKGVAAVDFYLGVLGHVYPTPLKAKGMERNDWAKAFQTIFNIFAHYPGEIRLAG